MSYEVDFGFVACSTVIKDRVEIKESVHEDGTKLGSAHGKVELVLNPKRHQTPSQPTRELSKRASLTTHPCLCTESDNIQRYALNGSQSLAYPFPWYRFGGGLRSIDCFNRLLLYDIRAVAMFAYTTARMRGQSCMSGEPGRVV